MLQFDRMMACLDQQVERVMRDQVMQEGRVDRGGFVGDDGLANPSGVSAAACLGYAYLLEESAFYGDEALLERLRLAAAFGRRVRRPSGCFDLLVSNFDSAPDTAFTVQTLAPVVKAARQSQAEGAAVVAEELGELVHTAAPGMARGGFHTPNHRWVLVSALAAAGELFPDLDTGATVEAYLAESIDINADGEYIERSTGVYNAVCNRALRLAADILDRPELLEPVRRNLEMSYHLMHADAAVVTSISSRQDRGTRTVPVSLADSYYWLARHDGNGFFAAVADWLVERGGWGGVWNLQPFVEKPAWRHDDLVREPLPREYAKVYPVSGLWRARRGTESATVAAGLTSPFALRAGEVELAAVRLSSTYFATGQFVGEEFAGEVGGARLRHLGRNRIYPEKDYRGGVYWLPAAEKVDAQNWQAVRSRRQTYDLPALQVDLHIRQVEGGYDLEVKTEGGLDAVPFQVEFVFEPGGELEADGLLMQGAPGATAFLKKGYATYRVGEDAVSFGPGEMAHRMWHMRNSEGAPDSFRVLLALTAPFERRIEIRTGRWSAVEGGLVS